MQLTPNQLLRLRLRSHCLVDSTLTTAAGVVQRMGAVQAQDYPGAKWAIGLRAPGLTEVEVERAFNAGEILRTHVLRPTWHFVTPGDLAWMLALTGPRIRAAMAFGDRYLEIDGPLMSRVRTRLERVLRDGNHLTRPEIAARLAEAGIEARGQRLAHLMVRAEIDRLVCSGPRRGPQFTYALFDERVPVAEAPDRDEALAAIAGRYFASHGPATAQDFGWWSGLTMADARRGLDIVSRALEKVNFEGRVHLVDPRQSAAGRGRLADRLLPNFDEYAVAYKQRGSLVHAGVPGLEAGMGLLSQGLLLRGRFAGTWVCGVVRGGVRVSVRSRIDLSSPDRRAIAAAASRYGQFLGARVEHSIP